MHSGRCTSVPPQNLDRVVRKLRKPVTDFDFDWEANERFTYCFSATSLSHYRYAGSNLEISFPVPSNHLRYSRLPPSSFLYLRFYLCFHFASRFLSTPVLVSSPLRSSRPTFVSVFAGVRCSGPARASAGLLTENEIHAGTWMKRSSAIATTLFPGYSQSLAEIPACFQPDEIPAWQTRSAAPFAPPFAAPGTANPNLLRFSLFPSAMFGPRWVNPLLYVRRSYFLLFFQLRVLERTSKEYYELAWRGLQLQFWCSASSGLELLRPFGFDMFC